MLHLKSGHYFRRKKDIKGHKRTENSPNIEKDSKGQTQKDTKGHKRTQNSSSIEKDSKGQTQKDT
ncbi:hypothetical protein BpHYR1_031101 [Brachionus plicatilis]|uniref:Uncharacterized protein n=1 Tax=Brachionus plicatilis TaxID=10195 RepID=A0A3M7SHY8_BRAPC|nr:hypothetical protein BpHYR1_031101 [Brachionus plicatilis]